MFNESKELLQKISKEKAYDSPLVYIKYYEDTWNRSIKWNKEKPNEGIETEDYFTFKCKEGKYNAECKE